MPGHSEFLVVARWKCVDPAACYCPGSSIE